MRTIYYTASSLDGFIADPAHSLAWLFAQEHVEPQARELRMDTLTARMGALVMGRTTYDWIRREMRDGGESAWPYTAPTWVLTHRDLDEDRSADIRPVEGDAASVMTQVRESVVGDGDVWVVGGGAVAGDLALAGLLDEVVVSYAPVTLGAGAPLLAARLQLALEEFERSGDFITARYTVTDPRPAADWAV